MSWREVYTTDLTGESSVSAAAADTLLDVVRHQLVTDATQSAYNTAFTR